MRAACAFLTAILVAVGLGGCRSHSSSPGTGRALPYRVAGITTGAATADDGLIADPPTAGYRPKVDEARARRLAARPPSEPGDPSTVESFRLARVTLRGSYAMDGGVSAGPFRGTEAWVELRLVPSGRHLPAAGGVCLPDDAYRWAVIVDAETGAVVEWSQGFARSRC